MACIGPPGTGKTVIFAVHALMTIIMGDKILVAAPSNNAVDRASDQNLETYLAITNHTKANSA